MVNGIVLRKILKLSLNPNLNEVKRESFGKNGHQVLNPP